MHFDEYQELAGRTEQSTPPLDRLAKNALGLAGEAGEVVELIKKHVYHDKDLSADEVKKELGDVLWYLARLAADAGWQLSEVAEANIEKLRARYPDGYSHEAAKKGRP